MSERFEMRVPDELMARLDAARGFEPRASFVKRALESALNGSSQEPLVSKAPSVSSRAPSGALTPEEASEALDAGRTSRPAKRGCPVARCEFRALSSAAKCPVHGRTVVAG